MEAPQNPAPQTVEKITSSNSSEPEKKPKKRTLLYVILGVLAAGVITCMILYFAGVIKAPGDLVKPFLKGDGSSMAGKVTNPLTGEIFSAKDAKDWQDKRPLAVMVNNYVDARPQSGLTSADLVYEVVAEGGITRFMPFFLSEVPEKIGPVRSTREYYLVLVKELGDAMIMHIGWSPQALVAIETWPVRSLGRGGATFWRDQARLDAGIATEHTAYVNGKELYERGAELGWEGTREFDVYKFKDAEKYTDAVSAKDISIDFWYEGDYSAVWKYDEATGLYMRFMGYDAEGNPIPHKDQETGEQIAVKNLIVQFADESSIIGDDKNRLEYTLIGSGEGLVFLDGRVISVTWSKEERDTRTKFYDINGNEMEFNRGKFWVSIVPSRNVDQVVYN